MVAWKLAPALAGGNCVVLKPADPTPASILVLMEIIADLVPDGVIKVINEPDAEIDKTLATSPRIAKEVCTCPSRALILESIYDRFMERAIDRICHIKQDNPLDPTTALDAQVSVNQMEKIAEYAKIGHAEGA